MRLTAHYCFGSGPTAKATNGALVDVEYKIFRESPTARRAEGGYFLCGAAKKILRYGLRFARGF